MSPKIIEQIVETIVKCGHVRTVEIAFEDKVVRFVLGNEPGDDETIAAEKWIMDHESSDQGHSPGSQDPKRRKAG